jgi:hypothetical protein
MNAIREPAVSGTFYPAEPHVLKREVETYLKAAAQDEPARGIVGLVAPHAGYIYSGQVAAYGYKALSGLAYDTVLVIAPSHRAHFSGAALLEKGAYKTPLGLVPIDEEISEKILKSGALVRADAKVHKEEHALEVQLPFLQTVLAGFKLVPLIMGSQDTTTCHQLTALLYDALKGQPQRFLIVGSTDLSHYYPYKNAVDLDSVVVGHLGDFDAEGILEDVAAEKTEACGAGPMAVTMMLSRKLGADAARVLMYANSGDVSGDRSAVVGYVSAVFYRSEGRDGT